MTGRRLAERGRRPGAPTRSRRRAGVLAAARRSFPAPRARRGRPCGAQRRSHSPRKPQCASGTAPPGSGSPTGAMKVRRFFGGRVLRAGGSRRRMEGIEGRERRSGVRHHAEVSSVQRLASAAQLLHSGEFRRPAVSIHHRRRHPISRSIGAPFRSLSSSRPRPRRSPALPSAGTPRCGRRQLTRLHLVIM